jgi:hypothetical protein
MVQEVGWGESVLDKQVPGQRHRRQGGLQGQEGEGKEGKGGQVQAGEANRQIADAGS